MNEANKKENYEVKNTLFDGQGLISTSLFDDDHKKGFVLLRQHMFKVACFKTNIELFFKDKFLLSSFGEFMNEFRCITPYLINSAFRRPGIFEKTRFF